MIPVLIYISIFITQIGVKAFGDWWYKKNKKKIINHFLSAVIDGSIYFLSAYFLFCAPDWCSIGFMFGIMLTSIGARWIIYDLVYNCINKHEWDHYGNSSWQDRQLKKLGKWHLIPKLLLIALGLILLIWQI